MYVAIKHTIRDPQTFWSSAQREVPNAPANIQIVQIFPNEDGTTATCLWRADSVASVRDFVEKHVGHVSENEYFAVNESSAVGLPAS